MRFCPSQIVPSSALLRLFSLCFVLCFDVNAIPASQPIIDDPILFVIHPYKHWDIYNSAKPGIDLAVERAKKKSVSVAYVLSSNEPVYLKDTNPTYSLMAPAGQFSNSVTGRNIFLAGGNWGFCLSNALGSILANHPRDGVKVRILSNATFIFMNEKNLAEYLAGLSESERYAALSDEFQQIADRWLKDEYCLVVHYENSEIFRTKGNCVRDAKIFLVRGSSLDTAHPAAATP